jgi:hypothetical protein
MVEDDACHFKIPKIFLPALKESSWDQIETVMIGFGSGTSRHRLQATSGSHYCALVSSTYGDERAGSLSFDGSRDSETIIGGKRIGGRVAGSRST